MMNAAEAISAIDITLRDGLNAALRKPRRHRGQAPRPPIGTGCRERSDDDTWHIDAPSSAAPAPKNIAVRRLRSEKAAASITAPAAASVHLKISLRRDGRAANRSPSRD